MIKLDIFPQSSHKGYNTGATYKKKNDSGRTDGKVASNA